MNVKSVDEFLKDEIAGCPTTASKFLAEIRRTVDPDDYDKMVVFVDGTVDTIAIANSMRDISELRSFNGIKLEDVEDPEEELYAEIDPKSLPKDGKFIFGAVENVLENKYWTVQDLIDALSSLNPDETVFYVHISTLENGDAGGCGDLNNAISLIENITTDLEYVEDTFFLMLNDGTEINVSDYSVGLVVWVWPVISNIEI
jgi:hypothetical protein